MNKRKPIDGSKALTIVGPGTHLTGELQSQGMIRVEGQVSGRIQSEDTIIIQESGRVKADLIARQVIISGEVDGNVYAHERIEITDNGRLIGDITAPRVSISEGVVFEGKCSMKAPGDMATSSNAKPAGTLKVPPSETAI